VLQDLTQLGQYAIVHNTAVFRTIKSHIPGPYTFILQATKEVPRRLRQPKRKTIGLRVPEHPITQGILASLGAPLMSVTLIMPNETTPLTDPEVIYDRLKGQVALIVDGGYGDEQPTTIVDLTKDEPTIIREGKGDTTSF